MESPGAGSSGVTGTSAPEFEAAPEQAAGPELAPGEAPAVETDEIAGGPPAAGTPSHEILPEDNLP